MNDTGQAVQDSRPEKTEPTGKKPGASRNTGRESRDPTIPGRDSEQPPSIRSIRPSDRAGQVINGEAEDCRLHRFLLEPPKNDVRNGQSQRRQDGYVEKGSRERKLPWQVVIGSRKRTGQGKNWYILYCFGGGQEERQKGWEAKVGPVGEDWTANGTHLKSRGEAKAGWGPLKTPCSRSGTSSPSTSRREPPKRESKEFGLHPSRPLVCWR